MKVTLELPKGLIDFWDWVGKLHNQKAVGQLREQIMMATFSMMEQLQASEIADTFGIADEYEKWNRDP